MQHSYNINVKWNGRTEDPKTYDRSYTIYAEGKEISGSADPSSKGDSAKWNPEEMLLASLGSCHMLWYLYLCATAKIVVTKYEDSPTGILQIDPKGKSSFSEVTLNPKIVITDASRIEEAIALQKKAHDKCYIVNSVNFEVKLNPHVSV